MRVQLVTINTNVRVFCYLAGVYCSARWCGGKGERCKIWGAIKGRGGEASENSGAESDHKIEDKVVIGPNKVRARKWTAALIKLREKFRGAIIAFRVRACKVSADRISCAGHFYERTLHQPRVNRTLSFHRPLSFIIALPKVFYAMRSALFLSPLAAFSTFGASDMRI